MGLKSIMVGQSALLAFFLLGLATADMDINVKGVVGFTHANSIDPDVIMFAMSWVPPPTTTTITTTTTTTTSTTTPPLCPFILDGYALTTGLPDASGDTKDWYYLNLAEGTYCKGPVSYTIPVTSSVSGVSPTGEPFHCFTGFNPSSTFLGYFRWCGHDFSDINNVLVLDGTGNYFPASGIGGGQDMAATTFDPDWGIVIAGRHQMIGNPGVLHITNEVFSVFGNGVGKPYIVEYAPLPGSPYPLNANTTDTRCIVALDANTLLAITLVNDEPELHRYDKAADSWTFMKNFHPRELDIGGCTVATYLSGAKEIIYNFHSGNYAMDLDTLVEREPIRGLQLHAYNAMPYRQTAIYHGGSAESDAGGLIYNFFNYDNCFDDGEGDFVPFVTQFAGLPRLTLGSSLAMINPAQIPPECASIIV